MKDMTVRDWVHLGVGLVVSVGTGVILGKYTGGAVSDSSGVKKICATVAATAITGYVAHKASSYMCDEFDMVYDKINEYTNNKQALLGGGEDD